MYIDFHPSIFIFSSCALYFPLLYHNNYINKYNTILVSLLSYALTLSDVHDYVLYTSMCDETKKKKNQL